MQVYFVSPAKLDEEVKSHRESSMSAHHKNDFHDAGGSAVRNDG